MKFIAMLLACAWALGAAADTTPGAHVGLGAHRGGMGEWPENTLTAFSGAAASHPGILLEGDLRLTSDGAVVLLHDATVERTTNGSGALAGMTLDAVKQLDAGYRFSPDDGATFPFRGKGVVIPTLDEVLDALPGAHFLLELKEGGDLPAAAAAMIGKHGAAPRVTVASFKAEVMNEFRAITPDVAACFDTIRALALLNALRAGDWDAYTPDATVLSLPMKYVAQFSLGAGEIARIRAKDIHVQVHTINEVSELERLAALGVDSVLTDYPSRLRAAKGHGE